MSSWNPESLHADGSERVQCLLKWADGSTYDGYVLGTHKHGFGIFTDYNRIVFEGNWEHDRKNGFFIVRPI
jgi:hypothetical protein